MSQERTFKLSASYYQQFDADYAREVPAEGFGGWKRDEIELSLEHTAVVVMHAWDCGTPEQFPGWWRSTEFLPRASKILREVFPPLLDAVRASPLPLFHVAGCGQKYWERYPGYRRTARLAGADPCPPERIEEDETLRRLREFKQDRSYVGSRNQEDVGRGFKRLDFPSEAKPRDDEGVAADARQLFALCKEARVNHLVYVGFAINWCLLMSRGGMVDMGRRGIMCSALRQAVTAVENKETARQELCKEIALWRVAIGFGFVFDVDDFVGAIKGVGS